MAYSYNFWNLTLTSHIWLVVTTKILVFLPSYNMLNLLGNLISKVLKSVIFRLKWLESSISVHKPILHFYHFMYEIL